MEIVYPPVSILAEPYVAWVDAAVARDGKLDDAKVYLTFLFSGEAQETIAHLGDRPYKPYAAGKAGVEFHPLTLAPITDIAGDWDDANEKFFAENGVIDLIIGSRRMTSRSTIARRVSSRFVAATVAAISCRRAWPMRYWRESIRVTVFIRRSSSRPSLPFSVRPRTSSTARPARSRWSCSAPLSIFDSEQRVEAAEAMFLLGVMVGSIQIFIAVFRLGDLTRYISESVILGFMSAAALLLAIGQIGNALGLREKGTGAQHVLHRLWLTLTAGDAINLKAVIATTVTLALAVLFRGFVRRKKWPQFDMLAVLVIVGVGAYLAGWTTPGLDGKTAIGVAGAVPSSLPTPHIPVVKLGWFLDLAPDAAAIAFLGLLEALAIAKSIAYQTRQPLTSIASALPRA